MKVEYEEHSKNKDRVVLLVEDPLPWLGPVDYELDPNDFGRVIEIVASFLVWLAPQATWRIEYERQFYDFVIQIKGDIEVNGQTVHARAMSPSLDMGDGNRLSEQVRVTLSHLFYRLSESICEAVLGKDRFEVAKQLPYKDVKND